MKNNRRRDIRIAVSIVTVLLVVIALTAPINLFGGDGCEPNTTCPPLWEVVPIECATGNCDTPAESGYCFRCWPPI